MSDAAAARAAVRARVARVVQPAQFPTQPISPRPLSNLALGTVLGLLVGYVTALVRYAMNTAPRSVDALQRIAGAPVLGQVAYSSAVPKKPLVLHQDQRAPRAEAFRQLRTNLQFLDGGPHRTVVVTSTLPEEGATTTACNLAIVLGQTGSRVVLVEGDLRRPRASKELGIDAAVGLSDVLSGAATLDQALRSPRGLPMDVLPSGPLPLNPSELLASEGMAEVLVELARRYDMVLIDTPPVLPVTDASALAAQCDGTLLVVRYGRTSESQLRAAAAALDTVSARLLGTVLNMTPESRVCGLAYLPDTASPVRRATSVGALAPRGASADGVAPPPAPLRPLLRSSNAPPPAPALRGSSGDSSASTLHGPGHNNGVPARAARPSPRPRLDS